MRSRAEQQPDASIISSRTFWLIVIAGAAALWLLAPLPPRTSQQQPAPQSAQASPAAAKPAAIKAASTPPPAPAAAKPKAKPQPQPAAKPAAKPAAAARHSCKYGRVAPLALPMANDQPPCLERPVALLFGDSLTERSFDPESGWGAALAHHFVRKVDVINRGFGGYNSRWGLKLLEQVLQQLQATKRQVVLMTLWFGANDAAIPGRSAERQHVPVEEFSSNLEAMVAMARAAGVQHVVLITPSPVGDEARVAHQQSRMGISTPVPPDRSLEVAGRYAAAVVALGSRLQLPVVDLYSQLQETPDWRVALFEDGLHFTPAGARQVWQQLRQVLLRDIPQLRLESMANQFPWWDKWDSSNPDAFWAATLPQLQSRAAAAEASSSAPLAPTAPSVKDAKKGGH